MCLWYVSEECDNLPDILESLCSAAAFCTLCCLSCIFGYSITTPDCFPQSFCLWCCVSDPSHGFSPLHLQTGHFLLSCRFLIANMPKGWNKLANQFTNTISLLQPQRHLVFIIIFFIFKNTNTSSLGKTESVIFTCLLFFLLIHHKIYSSWIFSLRDHGLLCGLFIFWLWFVSLSLTSPHATPLPLIQP